MNKKKWAKSGIEDFNMEYGRKENWGYLIISLNLKYLKKLKKKLKFFKRTCITPLIAICFFSFFSQHFFVCSNLLILVA